MLLSLSLSFYSPSLLFLKVRIEYTHTGALAACAAESHHLQYNHVSALAGADGNRDEQRLLRMGAPLLQVHHYYSTPRERWAKRF